LTEVTTVWRHLRCSCVLKQGMTVTSALHLTMTDLRFNADVVRCAIGADVIADV